MMKGIIITNQHITHNEYKIKRFLEEAKNLDISLTTIVNDGTLVFIDENGNAQINLECDFIIYLDKDIYLAKLLESKGYIIFNDSNFIRLCDDKLLTYISLVNHGIRMVKTYPAPLVFQDCLTESSFDFLDKIIEDLKFPFVVKKAFGSLGMGVFLVKNKEELINVYKEYYHVPLLFQEYVESSKGQSIRVLVIDHKIFGAFTRFNNDDFRSNFGEHASAKKFEINDKYRAFVEKIIDILDIKYAGIDLMVSKDNEPILCEINSNAFFEEFEKVTGLNAAKEYLLMIKHHLGKKQ